jgi:hypothetical protein
MKVNENNYKDLEKQLVENGYYFIWNVVEGKMNIQLAKDHEKHGVLRFHIGKGQNALDYDGALLQCIRANWMMNNDY